MVAAVAVVVAEAIQTMVAEVVVVVAVGQKVK
jgi:hypothetical protein